MAYWDLLTNARNMAANAKGYSQAYRGRNGYWDCSSFVGHALRDSGVNINPFLTTSDMNPYVKNNAMAKAGFEWHEGMDGVGEGDILWKNGHTEIHAGGNNSIGAHSTKNGVSEYRIPQKYQGYWRYTGERVNPALAQPQQQQDIPVSPEVAQNAPFLAQSHKTYGDGQSSDNKG